MDAKNTLVQHIVVGFFTLLLAFGFHYLLSIRWSTAFARVSFILLFLTLIIGPVTKLKKPSRVFSPLQLPWSWRSELGIWFTISSLLHFYFVMGGRPQWNLVKALGGGVGGGGYGLANFIGLLALIWSLILTATSFGKVIKALGIDSWRWLHSFTYVIFYLVSSHLVYFQFFSTYGGGPDRFGYASILMMVLVITLQTGAFLKTVLSEKKG